ncbi:MAG: hypothetical protein A4E45_01518 [Methanosaeta sp. PtaB.Bin039]|nr:MAG: hypothetical protein A4E45_01518 [Methanosaeta sp. PtaB.Bin039]HQJ28846.1 hypothetical protein [Methanotrichaceae archaeon]
MKYISAEVKLSFSKMHIAQQLGVLTMAGVEAQAVVQPANEAMLQEFKAGLRQSIKQADTGWAKEQDRTTPRRANPCSS